MFEKSIDLRRIREHAKLTQQQLGEILGLSQSQIDRIEGAPENASIGMASRWCRACGTSLEQELESAEGDEVGSGIDPGAPYTDLHKRLARLEEMVVSEAPRDIEGCGSAGDAAQFSISKLRETIDRWRRKPVVLLAGRFDSGKSRLANALMGVGHLPSRFQPETEVTAYIRHSDDKPKFQAADVWLMKKGFEPNDWQDRDKCQNFMLRAGGYELLWRDRKREGPPAEASCALVYINSPLLLSCVLVDTPGLLEHAEQPSRPTAPLVPDVLIYTSPQNGFLDGEDMLALSGLYRLLLSSRRGQGEGPLSRLFLVATHAHRKVPDEGIEDAREVGTRRLYNHFLGSSVWADSITRDQVKQRIFPFWAETPKRREALERDFGRVLATELPRAVRHWVDEEIRTIKESAPDYFAEQIRAWEQMMADLAANRRNAVGMAETQRRFDEKASEYRGKALAAIEKFRQESREFVDGELARRLETEWIEGVISERFQDRDARKEAAKLAPALLMERVQDALNEHLAKKSREFKGIVDDYLANCGEAAGAALGPIPSVMFDATGNFAGGVAGAAALGALGIWASTLGNLGGYIIIAKLAGLLTALGISTSSVAAVSFVAAIGGPVTVAIGVAAAVFFTTKAIFGETWQRRLAARIAKLCRKHEVHSKLLRAVDKFWDETTDAFNLGAGKVERGFHDYASSTSELLKEDEAGSRAKIEQTIAKLNELKSFFAGIPWRLPD